jgi:alginate O-acetyltransferase complex protein AlgI
MNFLFDFQSILLVIISIIGFYLFRNYNFRKFFLFFPTLIFCFHSGVFSLCVLSSLLLFTVIITRLFLKLQNEQWQTRLYWLTFAILIFGFIITEYINQHKLIQGAGIGLIFLLTASWISDVYLGRIKDNPPFLDLLSYFLFFPKLIAGPLEKTSNFYHQLLHQKSVNLLDNFQKAVPLILLGLLKKIIIADNLLQESEINLNIVQSSPYLLAFSFIHFVKIYADFSGMIDVVRGISILFGYQLLSNFSDPFLASGFKDYWNRWNISLSSWVHTYFYNPLSFALRSVFYKSTGIIVLVLSFLLITVWHGFSMTYLIFGILHIAFIIFESIYNVKWISEKSKNSEIFSRFIFLTILSLITLFFTNKSIQFPFEIIKSIFNPFNWLILLEKTQVLTLLFNFLLVASLYHSCKWFSSEKPLFSFRNSLILLLLIILWPQNPKAFIYEF